MRWQRIHQEEEPARHQRCKNQCVAPAHQRRILRPVPHNPTSNMKPSRLWRILSVTTYIPLLATSPISSNPPSLPVTNETQSLLYASGVPLSTLVLLAYLPTIRRSV